VDVRVDVPLYTLAEMARYLQMPRSTLRYWVHHKGIVRSLPHKRSEAYLPFMALAEAQFTQSMRRADLTLHAVEEAVVALREALGENWLSRDRLAHDGKDILFRLASEDPEWTRARDRQAGIPGVIELALQMITFDADELPGRVKLDYVEGADVVIDPRFAFGQPMIESRGVRVEDIAQLFFAGEPMAVVSAEFGVDTETVEAVLRAYGPRAA
jgi:uncharacterized protein (DUF433 family)